MRESGGASSCKAFTNASSASGEPSTAISTPADVLRTQPFRRCRAARLKTNGRNPTPWTMPEMWTVAPWIISFDIQGFHVELLSAPDACTAAAAVGAYDLPLHGMILRRAAHALQLGIDTAKVEPGALSDRSFGNLVPVELHRVIGVGGYLPHH